MRVLAYVYDSSRAPPHVEAVLAALDRREEDADRLDVAAVDDRAAGIREATLAIKEAVRVGGMPEALFDEDGTPDVAPGALITEDDRGRRSLHVGEDALAALQSE